MGVYETAQICLNGHTVTTSLEGSGLGASFCSDCGAATTSQCTACHAPIRGHYHVDGVFAIGNYYTPPSYCHACGKPYPWTEARMRAAADLADQLDELSVEDRDRLKSSIKDLAIDGPRTEVASFVYKKIVSKVGAAAGQALNGIIVSVGTAAAKKFLGL